MPKTYLTASDSVTDAVTRVLTNILAAGDTQPAWQVRGDGRMDWGVGGTTATDVYLDHNAPGALRVGGDFWIGTQFHVGSFQTVPTTPAYGIVFGQASDTNLYRVGTAALQSDGTLQTTGYKIGADVSLTREAARQINSNSGVSVYRATPASDNAFRAAADADSQYRFIIRTDGAHQWGPGATTAPDTNLYRQIAKRLQTDGGMWFAPTNTTDLALIAATLSDSQQRYSVDASGKTSWGPGGTTTTDTVLYRAAAALLATDGGLTIGKALNQKRVALTYGATVTTDASLGSIFGFDITNATAFTVANPTNLTDGQIITYIIRNTSGGAAGAITWGTLFKLSSTSAPANGNTTSIELVYNGANLIEIGRAGGVPN